MPEIFASSRARQLVGLLTGANMNSTADQAITIRLPNNELVTGIIISGFWVKNASTSLTAAIGGIYSAASKGGTVILTASAAYSPLTGVATQAIYFAATSPFTLTANGTIYLSLTTPQGGAATADFEIEAVPNPSLI